MGFSLPENGVTNTEKNLVVLIGIEGFSVNSGLFKITYMTET